MMNKTYGVCLGLLALGLVAQNLQFKCCRINRTRSKNDGFEQVLSV
jgi:hypothetical protein